MSNAELVINLLLAGATIASLAVGTYLNVLVYRTKKAKATERANALDLESNYQPISVYRHHHTFNNKFRDRQILKHDKLGYIIEGVYNRELTGC